MQPRRHAQWYAAVAGAGAVVLLAVLSSCSTADQPVFVPPLTIPGAHIVGNKACADCHALIVQHFPASPHARVHTSTAEMLGDSGCESCHGPGSKHIEAGGGRRFIINPGRDSEACFKCHTEAQSQFLLPQHHPVLEKRMNCVDCHDPHGGDIFKPAGGLAMTRQSESCANCHREQTRPVVFEHEAMREGCTVCHSPHGSVNRKFLVTPDSNLCLRCHAEIPGPASKGKVFIGKVDHTTLLKIGSCWASGCHTAIHGSNVDPRLRY